MTDIDLYRRVERIENILAMSNDWHVYHRREFKNRLARMIWEHDGSGSMRIAKEKVNKFMHTYPQYDMHNFGDEYLNIDSLDGAVKYAFRDWEAGMLL